MTAFRRLVIALAVLAVFAGLASAQTITPLACSVTLNTPSVRSEGKTEQVGDIVLTCNTGQPLPDGAPIPRANFQVQTGGTSAITSRVTSGSSTTPPILTDALLTIDEPGLTSGTPVFMGFGSDQLPTACTTLNSSGGCTTPAFKQTLADGTIVMSTSATAATPGAPNVFQGVLGADGTSVAFVNIPILPTSSSNSVRVFRITNIRVDATGGQSQINASVSSPSPLLSIPSNSNSVGAVMAGLSTDTTKVTFVGSAPVGISKNMSYVAAISFGEKFSTAFKTRLAGTAASGSVFNAPQNIPGPYLGESGYTSFGTATGRIGVADFGTRLKATFTNIPTGVRVFVSATNMVNTTASNAGTAVGDIIGTAATSNVPTSFAVLIGTTDTTPDSPSGPPLAIAGTGPVELTVSTTGAAVAVWEVVNTNNAARETLTFAVYVSYTANVPPVTGTSATPSPIVSLSYGPTFTPPTGSTLAPIPNFVDSDNIKGKVFDLCPCQTVLLFPYITTNAGFETGIAIANTTADSPVFSDVAQSGTCLLTFYPTPVDLLSSHQHQTPTVAAGETYTHVVSDLEPGFTGYMIAACNFQLAHGFAFIADWGNPATSSAMGYLALVVSDVAPGGSRTAVSTISEGLDQ